MTTYMIAQVIGLLFVVTGLGVFLNFSYFLKIVDEIAHHPALMFLISLFRLILGSLLVVYHAAFVGVIGTVIVVLGWVIMLAGIAGILFPHDIVKALPFWTKHPQMIKYLLGVFLVLGLVMFAVGVLA